MVRTETVSSDSVAQDQIRAFVERIEEEALLDMYLAALGMQTSMNFGDDE